MFDNSLSDSKKKIKTNRILLLFELLLIFGICFIIISLAVSSLNASANRTAVEIDYDYETLVNDYIATFNTIAVMVEEKIEQDYSFEEMNSWLQSKEEALQAGIGEDIYDGFALTYKGGYARSWSYGEGEYDDYDPNTRPWYQAAQKGNGQTVVVAPYVTFLDASYFDSDEYIVMTIAKKYNEEISFDYDLKITEIKKLLSDRTYDYHNTRVLLYDKDGYILSSNNPSEFAHNVRTVDDTVSESMSSAVLSCAERPARLALNRVDGAWKIMYAIGDSRNNTFCIMYPVWEVFHHNFLAVILIALLLAWSGFCIYRSNKKGILEFQRRDTQLTAVLNAAFDEHVYVDLEDMTFSGNKRFEKVAGTTDYVAGYYALLYLGIDGETKKRMENFLSPDAINKEHNFDGEMTSEIFVIKKDPLADKQNMTAVEISKMFFMMGKRRVMTLLFDDVTENAEILKQALKDAESANRAKTEFLSRMSHDIRTPMNAIIGMTHLAKEENCPPEIREYLDNIDSSSEFLLGLINDILDMSKIESGELELRPEPYTREDFETSVNTVIRPLMESKGIEFIFEMRCGADCIMTDRLRFSQIFFNLLSNAAKFTPRGGRVEFTAEVIPPRNGVYGARYCVKDNGIGMSEEFLPHIFENFSQERTHSNENATGTGLGLPIVKSLVDAMDGTIQVSSRLGEGTEFILELYTPLAEQEVSSSSIENETASLEGKEILLVEDNEMNILVAKRLLEKKGCHVTVAKDGKQAFDMFCASKEDFFDAILMDVRMPVWSGITATKEIRAVKRADAVSVPIIAMTADAFAEERKKTLDAGMNYHLSKPIEPKKLYEILVRFMSEE